jgi:hypothetical protein
MVVCTHTFVALQPKFLDTTAYQSCNIQISQGKNNVNFFAEPEPETGEP